MGKSWKEKPEKYKYQNQNKNKKHKNKKGSSKPEAGFGKFYVPDDEYDVNQI